MNPSTSIVRAAKRLISEPVLTAGIVVAAVNTAEDQSWKGYALAVGIALLRFVVSPVYGRA